MKKQLFPIGVLFSAVVLYSCGNNSSDTNTSATDSGTSTSDNAAQNTTTDTSATATANNVSDADKTFMMEAAAGGMMEVQAGQIAAQNASSDRVKAFGNMMVQDHTN